MVLDSEPTATVTVTISGHGGTDVSLTGATLSNDALTFTTSNWDTVQTVTVSAREDEDADNHTVTLTHEVASTDSGYDGATIDEVTVTVTDNDRVSWDVSASAAAMPETGGTSTVTVSSGGVSFAGDKTITLGFSDSTATLADDYTVGATALTLTAGTTSVTTTITAVSDALDEDEETILITAMLDDAQIGVQQTVTITDDDPEPGLTLGPATQSVDEEAGSATFTVTLDAASGREVRVDYATADGSAVSGSGNDYTEASGTLTFSAGDESKTLTVAILDDSVDEADEDFTLALSNSVNATVTTGTATVTITDTEAVSWDVSASPAAISETGGTSTVTVSSGAVSFPGDKTITLGFSDSTATLADDYTVGATALTLTAGTTSVTTTITAVSDTVDEGDETILVTAMLDDAQIGVQQTVTITDDDPEPGLTLSPATQSVDEEAGSATFTVTLDAVSGREVRVDYATADGSAVSGSGNDYTEASGTLTFSAGDESKTLTVAILDDSVDEADEDFTLALSNQVNATVTTGTATVTITDTEAVSWDVSASPAAISETGGTSTVTVSSGAVSFAGDKTITLGFSDSTATLADDYTVGATALTLSAGTTSVTSTITAVSDTVDEDEETILVTAMLDDAQIGVQQTVTITDDDPEPGLTLGPATQSVDEEAGSATFTVTLDAVSGREVRVDYATVDGSAVSGSGNDYTEASGTLTFSAGDESKTLTVAILDDSVDEADEDFTLALSNQVNATVTTGTATVTITDTEAVSWDVSASPAAISETGGTSTVTVSSGAVSFAGDKTITLGFSDSTATLADDYTVGATALTLSAGTTSVTSTITAVSDTVDEDEETILVTAMLDDAQIGVQQTVTITDDDPEPGLTLGPATQSVDEEAGSATFTVTLDAVSGREVRVDYATVDGSAVSGSGNDYTEASGTLTFSAGDESKTLTVAILDDSVDEADEDFTLALSNQVNATVTTGTATVTITDTEAVSWDVSASPAAISETGGTSTVTVSSGAVSFPGDKTITLGFSDSTATLADDYTVGATALTLTAGTTSVTTTITAVSDTVDEDEETILITAMLDDAQIGVQQTVTITDDDPEPGLTLSPATQSVDEDAVDEEAGSATFTVALDAASGREVRVDYATADGSAVSGSGNDYTEASGTLTFSAGDESKTLTVAILDDSVDEADEDFTLALSNSVNATVTAGTATVTITDTEAVSWDVSASPAAISETGGPRR